MPIAIPIAFAISAAVGAATGVAGLGLQGAQHAQLVRQIADQEELIKIQKKLSLYQLKQYEKEAG